jgi:hypothetical protein
MVDLQAFTAIAQLAAKADRLQHHVTASEPFDRLEIVGVGHLLEFCQPLGADRWALGLRRQLQTSYLLKRLCLCVRRASLLFKRALHIRASQLFNDRDR